MNCAENTSAQLSFLFTEDSQDNCGSLRMASAFSFMMVCVKGVKQLDFRHEWKHEINYADCVTLSQHVIRSVIKSKTAQAGKVELNLEVRLKEDNTDFVAALSQLKGVRSAVLVSYNGDYMG